MVHLLRLRGLVAVTGALADAFDDAFGVVDEVNEVVAVVDLEGEGAKGGGAEDAGELDACSATDAGGIEGQHAGGGVAQAGEAEGKGAGAEGLFHFAGDAHRVREGSGSVAADPLGDGGRDDVHMGAGVDKEEADGPVFEADGDDEAMAGAEDFGPGGHGWVDVGILQRAFGG